MTLFNEWHYLFFGISFVLFLLGILVALKQSDKKLVVPMLFSVTLVTAFLAFFSIFVVDKYTKKVELFKLKNKRLLSTEQIVYSGMVKNTGDYKIGKVVLEIKLVNRGNASGNVKGGSFYKPSGFFDFFKGGGMGIERSKPQTVTETFIVAKNLKAGSAKPFCVYFRYPGYFTSVA